MKFVRVMESQERVAERLSDSLSSSVSAVFIASGEGLKRFTGDERDFVVLTVTGRSDSVIVSFMRAAFVDSLIPAKGVDGLDPFIDGAV